jgi:PAS domain S-box-containing protein
MKSDRKGESLRGSNPREVRQKLTERKRPEEAFQQEQRNLKAVMDATSVGMLVFDGALNIAYANPAAEALCGIKLEDLGEKRCGNFIHCVNRYDDPRGCGNGRDCPQCPIYTGLTGIIREGVPGVQGEAMLMVEGRSAPFWVKFAANAIEFHRSRFAVLTLEDITDRKRAEETIRKRLTYEQLLSRVSALTMETDNVDVFQNECVKAIGEALGMSRVYIFEHRHETDTMDNTFEWTALGVIPQKENLQGVPSGNVPWWMDMLKKGRVINYADVEDIPDEGVKDILRPQGILSLLVVPLFVAGCYYGFIGFDECQRHRQWPTEDVALLQATARIMTGVIDRKRGEEALRLSEEKFSKAFQSSPAWVVISSYEDGRYIEVNEAFLKSVGFTREEVIGKTALELKIWANPEDRMLIISELQEKGFVKNREVKRRKKSGELLDILFSAEIIEIAGEKCMLSTSLDITERKRAEEDREKLIGEMKEALEKVKTLSGLLPICASCKKIRDDKGYWRQIESYIRDHSEAEFTHGICPECFKKLYPGEI